MACDHDATRASLRAFLSATTFLGFVVFADEVQAQGRCNGCTTTLAVSVDLARASVVRAGEIGATPSAPHESPVFEGETMEQHAERIIT